MTDHETLREALNRPDKVIATDRSYAWVRHTVMDAAREFLRLMETAETWWKCETHNNADRYKTHPCYVARAIAAEGDRPGPCRMVKASLHIHREGT